MTEGRRRPGRPATGQTTSRSIRIGPIWDQAATIAAQHDTTLTAVITAALEDYVMQHTTLPALSDATRAAVANVVDYTIEAEYGQPTPGMDGARMLALGGLMIDLGDEHRRTNGALATDASLRSVAETTLRILIRDGLAARECQCRQLTGGGCTHGERGVCHRHYEADVPPIDGALLCGTCHVTEYQTRHAD